MVLGFGSGLRPRLRIERASVLGLIFTVVAAAAADMAAATAGTGVGETAISDAPEPGATNGVSDLPNLISSPGAATSSLHDNAPPRAALLKKTMQKGNMPWAAAAREWCEPAGSRC